MIRPARLDAAAAIITFWNPPICNTLVTCNAVDKTRAEVADRICTWAMR